MKEERSFFPPNPIARNSIFPIVWKRTLFKDFPASTSLVLWVLLPPGCSHFELSYIKLESPPLEIMSTQLKTTKVIKQQTHLGFDDLHLAQSSPVLAVSYWRKHPLLLHLLLCRWLITLQKRVRRTWSTDSSVWVWVWWMLRVLAARARGRSRDLSKKSAEIVLMVPLRDKREARQCVVTLKSRQPFSLEKNAVKESIPSDGLAKWVRSGQEMWRTRGSGVAGGGVRVVSEEGRGSGGSAPGKIFPFPPQNNGVL